MPYRIESNDAHVNAARRNAAAARDLSPVSAKVAVFIGRIARRNAPVGKWRGGELKKSLKCSAVAPNEMVLHSPLPYARAQQYGGTIKAGGGKLGARLLAIPLNDTARAMLDKMGASQSLRTQDLQFIKTKAGKMFLVREAAVTRSGKLRKRGKSGRKPAANVTQILFMLVPRVTLRPNPPPEGYAPRFDDPQLKAFTAKTLRAHLAGG